MIRELYEREDWKNGDLITEKRMNHMDDNIYGIDIDLRSLTYDVYLLNKKINELKKIIKKQEKDISFCRRLIKLFNSMAYEDEDEDEDEDEENDKEE